MLDFEDEAHEIWAMAQLLPNECILDGVSRIKKKLEELAQQTHNTGSPKSAVEIVERLAAWSRKYPQSVVHSATAQKEYEKEIAAIENAAKDFIDS